MQYKNKKHKHRSLSKLLLSGVCFTILTLGLWSCQEDLTGDPDFSQSSQVEKSIIKTSNIKDHLASNVAKNLASSMSDPSVLDFVTSKANEQFDGDYNFLIEPNVDESLSSGSDGISKRAATFGSIIAGVNQGSRTAGSEESLLDSIARFYPLLQVFVPELSDEIEFDEDQDYLVAYVPVQIENNKVPAYDKDGNYFELSTKELPNRPVIVVSESERVIAVPKHGGEANRVLDCPILADAVYEDGQNTFYMADDYFASTNLCVGGGGPGGGGPGGGSGSNCERDSRTGKERFYRFKLKDMQTFREIKDDWLFGNLEIRVAITMARQTGGPITLNKVFHLDNADLKDCNAFGICNTQWRYESAEIVTWAESEYGSTMQWVWTEYDPGTTTTRNFSFSNSFKTTSGNTLTNTVSWSKSETTGTDILGESIVEYCDDIGPTNAFQYETGSLFFEVQ